MTILIDADGCPVVDIAIKLAKQHEVKCVIIYDSAHVFDRDGVTTITVGTAADGVDFALVNMIKPGDIVITQDCGLTAMSLAKRAIPINQDGMVYDENNSDDISIV